MTHCSDLEWLPEIGNFDNYGSVMLRASLAAVKSSKLQSRQAPRRNKIVAGAYIALLKWLGQRSRKFAMTTLRAMAEGTGSIADASRVILDPKSLPKWFSGVRSVKADAGYPSVGAQIRWTVGPREKWLFDATVTENRLPGELVQQVKTPSGDSRIAHRFTDLGGGRFRYEKTVAPTYRGVVSRMLAPLLSQLIIPGAMKGEVRRAVALVRPAPDTSMRPGA